MATRWGLEPRLAVSEQDPCSEASPVPATSGHLRVVLGGGALRSGGESLCTKSRQVTSHRTEESLGWLGLSFLICTTGVAHLPACLSKAATWVKGGGG